MITLKGLRSLQQVPVAFPSGVQGKPGIAQRLSLQWHVRPVKVALTFPMCKIWQCKPSLAGGSPTSLAISEGGARCSFCLWGCEFLQHVYLFETLQHLHPEASVQLVPGVCSPLAATAALGLLLTIRQERLVVLPALLRWENWKLF